ncbi:MAG: hypothetical protein AB9835_01795 [Eubacteriales bacterium]
MKEHDFKIWLENSGTMGIRPISDCISRNKRIENCLGIDLDDEYKLNRGQRIIELLTYTTDDRNNNIPSPIDINGDIYNGLASLKSAAVKYFEFCTIQ